MFCPHPLKRLRVEMKRLHPSDHEEAIPKKLPRKSQAGDAKQKRDEGDKGAKKGVKVLKGLTDADQKGAGGDSHKGIAISCQNNLGK